MEPNSPHSRLLPRVARGAAICWAGLALVSAFLSRPVCIGVVVGGGVMLGMLSLYRWLAPRMLAPGRARRGSALFWGAWAAKWPVLGALLYCSLRGGWASPLGIGIGLAIVPVVITALALGDLARETRGASSPSEGKA